MADSLDGFDPSSLTPLFSVQFTTCAYPISDLYASSPRYLYYALLVAVFLTQWHGWLANVFLGAAATYAGTAAIEAFILITHKPTIPPAQNVTIPYIDSDIVKGNATLSALQNLLTGYDWVPVTPAALELDIDAILAITVTGYLMMLPMHCWSSVVRASRARHLLMGIWNLLMLAGTSSCLVLWAQLYDVPLQFRFCYPNYPDTDSVTSDNNVLPAGVWQGTWNSTIWNTFQHWEVAFQLDDNCLYPCFNTTQILRRPSSLTASLSSSNRSPRTDYHLTDDELAKLDRLRWLMYTAIVVSAIVAFLLLFFTLSSWLRRLTRVPVLRPKELLWDARKELAYALWTDFKIGVTTLAWSMARPRKAWRICQQTPSRVVGRKILHILRFFFDILILLNLLFAMVLVPATIVVFIVWIEWYIHRDIVSQESPSQVGQWTSSVSIALVLVSALVLKLRYWMASRQEIEIEMEAVKKHLRELEELADEKRVKEDRKRAKKDNEKPVADAAATAAVATGDGRRSGTLLNGKKSSDADKRGQKNN